MNLHNVKEIRRTGQLNEVNGGCRYESKQDYENSSCEHR